ncbi:MAG: LapA family protein [Thermodesulfobacteriota bacterium]
MQFFYWLILLIAIGIAVFAIQNSSAQPVVLKFLFWQYETSLIYTLLGSVGLGILITLLFWIPRAIRSSFQTRELKKKMENLEVAIYKTDQLSQEKNKSGGG